MSAIPAPASRPVLHSVDDILRVLAAGQFGTDDPTRPTIERVDLLSHALQCADRLVERHPDDVELHVAGLLHDLGHHLPLSGLRGRLADHELTHGSEGASCVRGLLGYRVAALIELHVPAKRFLVTFDPSYASLLSNVSTYTLERQGGPMTDAEGARFRANPHAESSLELRRADDDAKEAGRATSSLASWRPVLQGLAAGRGAAVPNV